MEIKTFQNYLDKCVIPPLDVQNYLAKRGVDYNLWGIKYSDGVQHSNGMPFDCFSPDKIDKFKDYILVPLIDEYGGTVGILGRNCTQDDRSKYNLSVYRPIFKRGYVYGIDRLIPHLIKGYRPPICITEGWFDYVALSRVFPTVCTLTVNLSERQLAVLKRYFTKFIIAFDNDKYGKDHEPLKKLKTNFTYIYPPSKYKDWSEYYEKTDPKSFDISTLKILGVK
ncbi:MAG: toprim domain-containing protein [Candidatus Paceibacterota bacterium]